MADQDLEALRTTCRRIRKHVHASLPWEWDSRLQVVRVALTAGQSKEVYGQLVDEFGENWNSNSIGKAPPLVQALADQVFGMRHGQLLFTMNPESLLVIFVAWWPWEDGQNISLRVGIRPIEGCTHSGEEVEAMLKEWFGVT